MNLARAGGSRLCPLVRILLRSWLVRSVAAKSFEIFQAQLSKDLAHQANMLMNERQYQKLASLVAQRLKHAEAQKAQDCNSSTLQQKLAPSFESPTLINQSASSGSEMVSHKLSAASSFSTPQSQKAGSSLSRSFSSSSSVGSFSSSSGSVLSRESSVASQCGEQESQIFNEEDSQMPDLADKNFFDLGLDSDSVDETEVEDKDDAYEAIRKKRGGKIAYSVEDRIAVTPTVLAELDWRYLAPQQSSIYPQGRTKRNGHARKHLTLDFDEFKKLVKPIIRDLAGRCVNGGKNVHQRFFWAAYDVARKRRANHVQHWRLHNQPRDLIYGGRAKYIELYGDPWAKSNRKSKKRRRRKRRSVKNLTFDQPAAKQQKSHQAIDLYFSHFYKYFISLCILALIIHIIFIHFSGSPAK